MEDVEQLKRRLLNAQRALDRLRAYKKRRSTMKTTQDTSERKQHADMMRDDGSNFDLSAFDDYDTWVNRLVIHNPNMVVTQRIRDILLRYYFSSRQSRLFDCAYWNMFRAHRC